MSDWLLSARWASMSLKPTSIVLIFFRPVSVEQMSQSSPEDYLCENRLMGSSPATKLWRYMETIPHKCTIAATEYFLLSKTSNIVTEPNFRHEILCLIIHVLCMFVCHYARKFPTPTLLW